MPKNTRLKYLLPVLAFFAYEAQSYAFAQSNKSGSQRPRQAQDVFEESQKYGFRDNSFGGITQRFENPFGYSAPPIETKGFLISPKLNITALHNDNIRATEDDTVSDFGTNIAARLRVTKLMQRHAFSFDLKGDLTRYADISDENTENFEAKVGANFEAMRGINIPIEIKYLRDTQDRTNQRIDSVTKEPVTFDEANAKLGFVYEPRRLKFATFGQFTQRRFDNNTVLNTGAVDIREDRDLDIYEVNARLSYAMKTGWEPFIQGSYIVNDYLRNEHDGTGFNGNTRDNNRFSVLTGFLYDYKSLVTLSLAAGYETRQFKDADVDDSDGLALNARLEWVPTQKTKWNFRLGQRNIDDNVIAAGFDELRVDARVQHELQHDLFGVVGARYLENDFTETDRQDDLYELQAGLQYIMSPRIQLGAEYLFQNRDSTQDGFSYNQNIFMLRLQTGL